MKSNTSDHNLYQTFSSFLKSLNDKRDDDLVSVASLDISNVTGASTTRRRSSIKRSLNTVNNHNVTNGNGLIINGSLFDAQLFQPARSTYIIDYSNTPHDLNQFIQGHNLSLKEENLDNNLFKLSFIMTLSECQVNKEVVLDYCPHYDDSKEILEEISCYKRFCFPEVSYNEKTVDELLQESSTYVFTRTNSDGEVEYGYCRRIHYGNSRITRFPIVICIVSKYSYFKLYDTILTELMTAYTSNEVECGLLMQSFYSKPLPIPTTNSSGIACVLNHGRLFFYISPTDERLNHDYFATLISCLSPGNIIYILDSMLRSRKILCFSKSLSKLTKCCLALSFLLYPFIWPYPFVSLMPSSWLEDLLGSPCPYIYGCLYETLQQLPSMIERDTLCIDLDLNVIDMGYDGEYVLPVELRDVLRDSLDYLTRFRLIRANVTLLNIAVNEAVLRVFTELFCDLPTYFKRHEIPIVAPNKQKKFTIVTMSFKRRDSGVDVESVVSSSAESDSNEDGFNSRNRLDYDFRSDDFLISQSSTSYVAFLNEFIHGMIFLKFLDDYQRVDNKSEQKFSLFSQRLNERRRMTSDELSINPVDRFRRTFDLLEKRIKQASKTTNPLLSKLVRKIF